MKLESAAAGLLPSSAQDQVVPRVFAAGPLEFGGISFMVLKKSTS